MSSSEIVEAICDSLCVPAKGTEEAQNNLSSVQLV